MSWESGVLMAGVGLLWWLAVLIINLDKEHAAIRLFLLLISAWYAVALINLGLQFAVDASAATGITNGISVLYNIAVWIARVLSAYYILYYLYYVFNMVRENFNKSRLNNK